MKKLTKQILTGAILSISSVAVFAASKNAGQIIGGLGEQAGVATTAAILFLALLGIVFMIMGGMNFKKYADNPQQTAISKPIIFLAAGALLFGLSATSDTMQNTIFGVGEGVSADASNKFK